jgi:hypothetical protein
VTAPTAHQTISQSKTKIASDPAMPISRTRRKRGSGSCAAAFVKLFMTPIGLFSASGFRSDPCNACIVAVQDVCGWHGAVNFVSGATRAAL